jgi:hypothetical protein
VVDELSACLAVLETALSALVNADVLVFDGDWLKDDSFTLVVPRFLEERPSRRAVGFKKPTKAGHTFFETCARSRDASRTPRLSTTIPTSPAAPTSPIAPTAPTPRGSLGRGRAGSQGQDRAHPGAAERSDAPAPSLPQTRFLIWARSLFLCWSCSLFWVDQVPQSELERCMRELAGLGTREDVTRAAHRTPHGRRAAALCRGDGHSSWRSASHCRPRVVGLALSVSCCRPRVVVQDLMNTALGWLTLTISGCSSVLSVGGGATAFNEVRGCA